MEGALSALCWLVVAGPGLSQDQVPLSPLHFTPPLLNYQTETDEEARGMFFPEISVLRRGV